MTLVVLEGGPDKWAGHVEDYSGLSPAQLLRFDYPTAYYRQTHPLEEQETSQGKAIVFSFLGEEPPFNCYDEWLLAKSPREIQMLVAHVEDDPLPEDVLTLIADLPIYVLGPSGLEGKVSKPGYAFRPDFKKFVLERLAKG